MKVNVNFTIQTNCPIQNYISHQLTPKAEKRSHHTSQMKRFTTFSEANNRSINKYILEYETSGNFTIFESTVQYTTYRNKITLFILTANYIQYLRYLQFSSYIIHMSFFP